jgi:hypothetical protein
MEYLPEIYIDLGELFDACPEGNMERVYTLVQSIQYCAGIYIITPEWRQ